jgi:hypothetical protein
LYIAGASTILNIFMAETLMNVVLAVAILGVSAVLTELYARKMYNRCPRCASLNARRRTHCRVCGETVNRSQQRSDGP